MRLRVYLWISFLVWTAAGCSKTDLWTEPSDQQGVHDVEVTFDVGANGVNRTLTYANLDDMAGVTFVPDGASLPQGEPPRKVLSSNNLQQVNDVRIYVFRRDETGTFTYYKPSTTEGSKLDYLSVDDFARKFDLSPYILWWGGSDDRNETHRYVGRMRLESGAYRFLALARDDKGTSDMRLLSDPNVATSQWGSQEWREGITSLDEASLSCSDSTVTATTELFSGSTTEPITVDGSVKHFSCSIQLERAVAGVLLYVENIPATLEAYDPDEEMSVGIIPDKQRFPVVSVAVVHGKVLSNKVRVADRGATAGDLDVSEYNSMLNPPSPTRTLLKIDIPEQATVLNNLYINTFPGNSRHPNSLLGGSFVMPQAANAPPDDLGRELRQKPLSGALWPQHDLFQGVCPHMDSDPTHVGQRRRSALLPHPGQPFLQHREEELLRRRERTTDRKRQTDRPATRYDSRYRHPARSVLERILRR